VDENAVMEFDEENSDSSEPAAVSTRPSPVPKSDLLSPAPKSLSLIGVEEVMEKDQPYVQNAITIEEGNSEMAVSAASASRSYRSSFRREHQSD